MIEQKQSKLEKTTQVHLLLPKSDLVSSLYRMALALKNQ